MENEHRKPRRLEKDVFHLTKHITPFFVFVSLGCLINSWVAFFSNQSRSVFLPRWDSRNIQVAWWATNIRLPLIPWGQRRDHGRAYWTFQSLGMDSLQTFWSCYWWRPFVCLTGADLAVTRRDRLIERLHKWVCLDFWHLSPLQFPLLRVELLCVFSFFTPHCLYLLHWKVAEFPTFDHLSFNFC